VIPGHEWAGIVIDVGANVESVRAGDRVVCEGLIGCSRCGPCRRGETHWCERIKALGFTRPGGYAELATVPAWVVHPLPDHVSFDAGVLIGPASIRAARSREGAAAAPRDRRRDRHRDPGLAIAFLRERITRRRAPARTRARTV
jgi:threonine dehydrogenase-like Zn-dependent dehydrogenase